jgi:hypothetical protein
MGPTAFLDDVEKRKFLTLPRLELRPLAHPARSRYTACAIPAPILPIINNVKNKIILDRPINSILFSTGKMLSFPPFARDTGML